jgi:hypothetical protein
MQLALQLAQVRKKYLSEAHYNATKASAVLPFSELHRVGAYINIYGRFVGARRRGAPDISQS